MPLVILDLYGDEEEEETKKALPVEEEPRENKRERLQKQVINIHGQIVEI